jgi:hypothetical protein
MNTISLHVNSSLAKIYRNADEEKKKKVEQFFSAWLSSYLGSNSPDDRLFDIMKQSSEIAKRNGMTPEILEQILKDEA